MRITLLATAINQKTGGGSHRNIIAIVRALKEAGHEVDVHTVFSSRNDLPSDVSATESAGEGLSFFGLQHLIAQMLSSSESDINFVYGHTLLWGAGAYRMCGATPVVVYLDNYLDTMPQAARSRGFVSSLMHSVWERTLGISRIRAVDRYLAVSPHLRDVYEKRGFPAAAFEVVPNFFEWSDANVTRTRDVRCMLYVGRLVREKGIEDLLQALAGLSSGLSWRVRIVGDGPLRALVETHAARDHRIEYVPWTREEQLLGEYASAGIFVHPARWPEPFGRTVVEALHAGLPVVVPEEGAAADIAGDAGVTFANSDVASLTHALTALLTDPQKQRELGERGPSRAKRFSKNVVVPELLRILGSVRKSGHGSPQ